MLTRARPKQASGGFFSQAVGFQPNLEQSKHSTTGHTEGRGRRPLLHGGAAFADVGFYNLFPFSLGFEDEFNGVAESAVAAGVGRDVVGLALYFGAGVLDGDGEASGAHGGEVDDVVADEGGFLEVQACILHDFLEGGALVLNSLANVFEFQVACAQGNGFGDALGDEAGPDASEASKRNRGAVVGVKAFSFDQRLALQAKSAFTGVFRRALLGSLVENALMSPCGSGEDEQLAVGEDAVDVEEKKFDLAGAGLSG